MNVPFTRTSAAITLFFRGKAPKTVHSTHVNFAIVAAKLKEIVHNVPELEALASPATALASYVQSELTNSVTVQDGVVYFNGQAVGAKSYIVTKILEFMKQGENPRPLMAFFARLGESPAGENLLKFLEYQNMPITERGTFLAYKGVQKDYWSKTGNLKTKVIQGQVDAQGKILNTVGTWIEVARESVCTDVHRGCEEGLHAGSYGYAKGFKGDGRLLVVEVDPIDVMSVPHDCNHQKLRTMKYFILEELDPENPAPLTEAIRKNKPVVEAVKEEVQPVNPPLNLPQADKVADTTYGVKPSGQKFFNVRDAKGRFGSKTSAKAVSAPAKGKPAKGPKRDSNGRFC